MNQVAKRIWTSVLDLAMRMIVSLLAQAHHPLFPDAILQKLKGGTSHSFYTLQLSCEYPIIPLGGGEISAGLGFDMLMPPTRLLMRVVLSTYWRQWLDASTELWMILVVQFGHHISFLWPSPLTQTPKEFPSYRLGSCSVVYHERVQRKLSTTEFQAFTTHFSWRRKAPEMVPVIGLPPLNTVNPGL